MYAHTQNVDIQKTKRVDYIHHVDLSSSQK